MQKEICSVCAEGAETDRTCPKCFPKLLAGASRAGDFSLDDALWSGRPVEVDSDQIETLIENNQRSTMWESTNTLKIPKSIMLSVK